MNPRELFEDRVLRPLRSIGRRARVQAALEGVAVTLAMWVVLSAAQYAVDRLLHLELGPRAVMLGILSIVVLFQAWQRIVRPIGRDVSVDALAAYVEKRDPRLTDEFISAVQFAGAASVDPRFDSPALVTATIARAAERLAGFYWRGLLDVRRFRGRLALGAGAMAVVAAAAWADPVGLAVFASRNLLLSDTVWPLATRLEVVGFRNRALRWPRGDTLTIVVNARGEPPRHGLRMRYETEGGQRGERALAAVGETQFRLEFGEVDESLRIWFLLDRIGAAERSDEYRVSVVDRPAVRRLSVRVRAPAYIRQPASDWPIGQFSGDVLAGSTVEMSADLNKPVSSARLMQDGHVVMSAEQPKSYQCVARFVPVRSGNYSFDLTDANGLADLHPATCALRLQQDRPPRARLQIPGVGGMVVAGAVLPIVAEIEDNYGLASAELNYRIERGAPAPTGRPTSAPAATGTAPSAQPDERYVALRGFEPYQTRFRYDRPWPLEPMRLVPSDRLSLFVRATDFNTAPPSSSPATRPSSQPAERGEGRSTQYTLQVVTTDELLAELSRRESEWRAEFELALAAQERLESDARDAIAAESDANNDASKRRKFADLARIQRQQGTRLKSVRRQFQDILGEMQINQLATSPVRRRLDGGIVIPLGALVDIDMADAATRLDRLEKETEKATAGELMRMEAEIVRKMRAILANMLKWEGFNETVGLLQELLKLQSDVQRQTQEELDRRVEELFGQPMTTQPAGEK